MDCWLFHSWGAWQVAREKEHGFGLRITQIRECRRCKKVQLRQESTT